MFPNEPIITVRAPAVQAQLVETYLLLCINHQTLIATKANRIVRAAQGRAVSEFGSRRAHGADAAILGARAAGIGGCSGTACTITDQLFGFNATGTMAHSWVQMFDSELEASAKEALAQIERQQYVTAMKQQGITHFFKVGVSFYKKHVKLLSGTE